MKKFTLLAIVISWVTTVSAQSEIIDEAALFSNADSVVINSNEIVSTGPIEEEKKSLGISGEATSVSEYTHLSGGGFSQGGTDGFSNYVLGNLNVDARLKKGTKGFANLQAVYNPNNPLTREEWSLKEFFIDFNLKNRIYFRTGKQVLVWGRTYLWNPSDLINIEKNTFIERIGAREGTYGFKIHVPFGTKYNIYGFIDTNNVKHVGGAGKFEFVSGKTEMAFSAWGKKDHEPVLAYDFSTRVFGIDAVGEAAFSYGDNTTKVRLSNGIVEQYSEKDKLISKASINFGKSFDYKDEIDKYSINMEFYYNQAGYALNVFEDETLRDYLISNNLYDLNYLSRYYAVLFTRINKFLRSELTLSMNLIGNLDDNSYIFTSGLNYLDINDLKLGLLLYFNLGEKNREYTVFGTGYRAQITIGMFF